ncbi:MAG: hypothetical protein J6Y02_18040 [Pseudobutyrivibrio sp.]|nr:hypothetical protein [Pseudobutyrivibrio sp.]
MPNKTFNSSLFSALSEINYYKTVNSNSLEAVLKVLNQTSDTSRKDRLNHNCRINGLPFCWSYFTGYGDEAVEHKVLSFPMTKISTGWAFVLDIEENGNLYLSEGKGTNRTQLKLSDLNAFSPSTREAIYYTIEHLCNSRSEKVDAEELFYFYKQTCSDAAVETVYQVFDDTDQPYLYRAQQIKDIFETRYLQFDCRFDNPNPYDDALAVEPKKHVIMVRWSEEHGCWYADFVFDGEAWGFNCLNDAGTYQVDDNTLALNLIDEDTGEIDKDTMGYKLSSKMEGEIESAVYEVAHLPEGSKTGSWIVIPGKGYCYRRWSEVPEEDRIHIFVAPTGTPKYYDDIEELDFSPENGDEENPDMARLLEGSCRFKYHHVEEEDEE